jgi:membrane protease YdiL (CAAX protease family)
VLSFKPWKIESMLQMLLGLFGGVAFVGFFIAALGYRPAPDEIDPGMLLLGAFTFHGAGLLWLNWFIRDHDLNWPTLLGLRTARLPVWLVLGVAVGIVGFYFCHFIGGHMHEILTRFDREPELQSTVKALQSTVSPVWAAVFGIVSIVLAPVVEEIIFRGLLFPVLKQAGFPLLAWGGTSLLFALSHFNLQAFVPLAGLALMLTWLYDRTDNLMAPIAAHATFNAINFTLTLKYSALLSVGTGS